MPENDGRVVAKSIVPYMDIRSANAAVADFEFYLVITADRLFDINDSDVTLSGRILNDSFH